MDIKKMLEGFDTAYNTAFNAGDAAGSVASFAEDLLLLPRADVIGGVQLPPQTQLNRKAPVFTS